MAEFARYRAFHGLLPMPAPGELSPAKARPVWAKIRGGGPRC